MWLLIWAAIVKFALGLPAMLLTHWQLVLSLALVAVNLNTSPFWLRSSSLVMSLILAAFYGSKMQIKLPSL